MYQHHDDIQYHLTRDKNFLGDEYDSGHQTCELGGNVEFGGRLECIHTNYQNNRLDRQIRQEFDHELLLPGQFQEGSTVI